MKKTLLLLTLTTTMFFSCKKEEEPTSCNCGTITDTGLDTQSDCYWLEIQNECSENNSRFCFDYDTWTSKHVGKKMCINNVSKW